MTAAVLALLAGLAGSWLLARAVWGPGLLLLATGVAALRWPRSVWDAPALPELSRRARYWGVLAVTALAALYRIWRFDQPGLWGDDAINGLLAFDILDGHVTSPFQLVSHSHSRFHALVNYPSAAAFWLFGADLWTLRLPGVLLGIAGAPLLYGIVAPLFGARAALLAALFYASAPAQLTHAKQLTQIIAGQTALLAALCLLVRGLARQRRLTVALSGVPFALCLYTYHSARIAPLIGVACAAAWRWQTRRAAARTSTTSSPAATARSAVGAGRAPRRSGLVLALLAFGLVATPAMLGWARDPHALVGRINATSVWTAIREQQSWWPLWEASWRTLAMTHYQQGPEYHWFGLGFDPAFNLILAALVAHGLTASLRGWREPRHLLLLTWVAVGLLPGVLSGGAPRLYRALLALPALYVWAALPLAALLASARARGCRPLRALVVVLAVAAPLLDAHYYFYRVYSHPVFHWYQGARLVEMARALRARGPGWTGYLMADTFDARHETLRFLARAWQLDLRDVSSLADVLPPREVPSQGALYLFSEATLPAAAAVAARYPGHALEVRHEPTLRSWALDSWWPLATWPEAPRQTFATIAVPRAALERPRDHPPIGLEASFALADRTIRRHEPYPFYAFMAPTFDGPFRSRFSGRLAVPPGGARLDVETNTSWDLQLDGRSIGIHELIPAGTHAVVLALDTVPDRLALRLWWTPRNGRRALIPPRALRPPAPAPAVRPPVR